MRLRARTFRLRGIVSAAVPCAAAASWARGFVVVGVASYAGDGGLARGRGLSFEIEQSVDRIGRRRDARLAVGVSGQSVVGVNTAFEFALSRDFVVAKVVELALEARELLVAKVFVEHVVTERQRVPDSDAAVGVPRNHARVLVDQNLAQVPQERRRLRPLRLAATTPRLHHRGQELVNSALSSSVE